MDSGNAYIYTGGVAPAEQVNLATGSIMYLVTDSLGSVGGVVNSSGTLTATTSYDAWGNPETTGGLSLSTPLPTPLGNGPTHGWSTRTIEATGNC